MHLAVLLSTNSNLNILSSHLFCFHLTLRSHYLANIHNVYSTGDHGDGLYCKFSYIYHVNIKKIELLRFTNVRGQLGKIQVKTGGRKKITLKILSRLLLSVIHRNFVKCFMLAFPLLPVSLQNAVWHRLQNGLVVELILSALFWFLTVYLFSTIKIRRKMRQRRGRRQEFYKQN